MIAGGPRGTERKSGDYTGKVRVHLETASVSSHFAFTAFPSTQRWHRRLSQNPTPSSPSLNHQLAIVVPILHKKLKKLLKYTPITTIKTQHRTQAIRQQILGPKISEPITNGLRLKRRRPAGGGRKGFELGSVRPIPAGCCSAFSIGQIWTPIKTFPICSWMDRNMEGFPTNVRLESSVRRSITSDSAYRIKPSSNKGNTPS